MKEAIILQQAVHDSLLKFQSISEDEWNYKPSETKWSRKEILGHLCDSAMNNLRRFVVSQYEENNKIVYRQDDWVASQDYQNADYKDIIQLWKLLNEQVVRTIKKIPQDKLQNTCITEAPHTLQWLIEDYIPHLNHHISQILN
jgi:DinB superfamily